MAYKPTIVSQIHCRVRIGCRIDDHASRELRHFKSNSTWLRKPPMRREHTQKFLQSILGSTNVLSYLNSGYRVHFSGQLLDLLDASQVPSNIVLPQIR